MDLTEKEFNIIGDFIPKLIDSIDADLARYSLSNFIASVSSMQVVYDSPLKLMKFSDMD